MGSFLLAQPLQNLPQVSSVKYEVLISIGNVLEGAEWG
jgi:hypothetical protein